MTKRISPATAISLVALFFSITGAGLAASRFLITSTSQIKPSVLHALKGNVGPRGATGPQGIPGPQGPVGIAASAQTYFVTSAILDINAEAPTVGAVAACNQGDHVVSGGFLGVNEIVSFDDTTGPNAWHVVAHLESGTTHGQLEAWALCNVS